MDAKLDGLIEKIKSEGINEAQKTSESIVSKAKTEAQQILANAKLEATGITEQAKKDAEKLLANGQSALKQAERDTILTTREQLNKLFDKVFKQEIGQVMTVDFMQQLISKMVDAAAGGTQFLVSEKDIASLQGLIFTKTREGLGNEVAFKVDKGVSGGFRVGRKGDNVYYDFTDQSIAEYLREFLSPGINELLTQ